MQKLRFGDGKEFPSNYKTASLRTKLPFAVILNMLQSVNTKQYKQLTQLKKFTQQKGINGSHITVILQYLHNFKPPAIFNHLHLHSTCSVEASRTQRKFNEECWDVTGKHRYRLMSPQSFDHRTKLNKARTCWCTFETKCVL